MRFGGHETFAVREGWLFKGLRMLRQDPERLYDEHVADHLGVGRNMAKSIRHWLLATELAAPVMSSNGRKIVGMEVSPFGELVWEHDRFFLERDTWWLLHINLVTNPSFAAAWMWFFNEFRQRRFDRFVALEALRRHLEVTVKRVPSIKTLQRDVACLLATYSRSLPAVATDPEDANESPFIELDILSHFRDSGMYQMNLERKPISAETMAYALARSFGIAPGSEGSLEVTLLEALQAQSGPCRVFGLTIETLFETVLALEGSKKESVIELAGLAGERVIRIPRLSPEDWVRSLYSNLEGSRNAA